MMQLFGRGILMSVFLLVQEGMPGLEYNQVISKVFEKVFHIPRNYDIEISDYYGLHWLYR